MNRHIEYFLRRVHRDESGAVAVLVEIDVGDYRIQ